jgi:hypothetical protein
MTDFMRCTFTIMIIRAIPTSCPIWERSTGTR